MLFNDSCESNVLKYFIIMLESLKETFSYGMIHAQNKTKVISADLLEFNLDLDLNFFDIFRFCDILV